MPCVCGGGIRGGAGDAEGVHMTADTSFGVSSSISSVAEKGRDDKAPWSQSLRVAMGVDVVISMPSSGDMGRDGVRRGSTGCAGKGGFMECGGEQRIGIRIYHTWGGGRRNAGVAMVYEVKEGEEGAENFSVLEKRHQRKRALVLVRAFFQFCISMESAPNIVV